MERRNFLRNVYLGIGAIGLSIIGVKRLSSVRKSNGNFVNDKKKISSDTIKKAQITITEIINEINE